MSATPGLERTLVTWLDEEGPHDVPARVVEAALAEARTVGQRSGWLTTTWWDPAFRRAASPVGVGGGEPALPTLPAIRPSLRLAWIVAAVAALMALLGGLLAVGGLRSEPLEVSLTSCPAGTTPDTPGAKQRGAPDPVALRALTWDSEDGRSALAFYDDDPTRTTWRFDVCTNQWRDPRPDPGVAVELPWPGRGAVLVHDASTNQEVLIGDSGAWSYRPGGAGWESLGRAPVGQPIAAAFDPMTGVIVVVDDAGLATFNATAREWNPIDVRGPRPDLRWPDGWWRAASLAYDASRDRFVLAMIGTLGSGTTFELDLRARTWIDRSPASIPAELGWVRQSDVLLYDPESRRILAFGDGRVAAYDPSVPEWRFIAGPGGPDAHWAVKAWDPVNKRVIAIPMGRFAPTLVGGQFTWGRAGPPMAFDPRSESWIPLVSSSP